MSNRFEEVEFESKSQQSSPATTSHSARLRLSPGVLARLGVLAQLLGICVLAVDLWGAYGVIFDEPEQSKEAEAAVTPTPTPLVTQLPGTGQEPTLAPTQVPTQESTVDPAVGCWDSAEILDYRGNEAAPWSRPPSQVINPTRNYTATIETNRGTITVDLHAIDAPTAVNNFVCLARAGYYDNTPVARIVPGFLVQAGDPTGTGRGGPGYTFGDDPITGDYSRGALVMSNAGPNTNGSQFFIALDNLKDRLPGHYTTFGRVTQGQSVLNAIGQSSVDFIEPGATPSTRNDRVMIETITISES